MNNLPNFCQRGYQIQKQIGKNSAGDRITYLAQIPKNQTLVIIQRKSGAMRNRSQH